MRALPKRIYIDALALVPDKKSGIGFTVQQTLAALAKLEELQDWEIYLIAPFGKAKYLKQYAVSPNVYIKSFLLPARGIELLMRTRLLPPIDWVMGRGIYIFPNYRNLPVWRSRSLTYMYDASFIVHPHTGHLKNQRYFSRYIKLWTARTDRIITISEQMRTEIEQYLNVYPPKIAVVPCGVDRQYFTRTTPAEVTAAKQKYGIPYENYLLYVGNIEPRKNLLTLLEAYEQLPARIRSSYGLVFVGGDGWLNEDFYSRLQTMQAKGCAIMKVTQFVASEDLPALYSGAALLVQPAIYEGFGMTPLEAMACGAPVAVSDIPAVHEVVGEAGHYFDASQSVALGRMIERVLAGEDDTAHKIRIGLKRSDQLSWQNSAQKLYTVIHQEWKVGPQAHPLLTRAVAVYRHLDGIMLRLAGIRHYPKYQLPKNQNECALRQQLYDDFLSEQPSRAQSVLLKVYVRSKLAVGRVLRLILRPRRGM